MPTNHESLYRQAFKTWGIDLQFMVLFEEMAELQKAICKYFRNVKTDKPLNIANIIEEMADVEIMLEQMKCYFHCDEAVLAMKKTKLDRLQQRLNEGKKEAA